MASKEQEIAGAGTILQFFTDINTCMDDVSVYVLGIDEIELKYPVPKKNDGNVNIPDEIEEYSQNIRFKARYSILRCHIQLKGIQAVLKDFIVDSDLEAIYDRIRKTPQPSRDDCLLYIEKLYKGFVTSILPNLIRNIDVYSQLIKE